MDYPVPDFGQDHDIKASLSNERLASKMVGKEWRFKTPGSWEEYRNKAKDTNYNFKPALDHDVVSTQKNIANAEGEYGNWDLVQTSSDPICSSAGCTQYKHPEPPKGHPMNYFVPDFGVDNEIINSMEDERVASTMLSHEWKFKTPGSFEKYKNKAKDTMYNFKPALFRRHGYNTH